MFDELVTLEVLKAELEQLGEMENARIEAQAKVNEAMKAAEELEKQLREARMRIVEEKSKLEVIEKIYQDQETRCNSKRPF